MSFHIQLPDESNESSSLQKDCRMISRGLPPISVPLPTLSRYPYSPSSWNDLQSPCSSSSQNFSTSSSISRLTPSSPVPQPSPNSILAFPAFASFIPEIRDLIWHLTLPSGRLVPVYYTSDLGCFPQDRFTSPALLPAALSVCKESRDAALRSYTLSFRGLSCETPSNIYFDPTTDIMYFPEVSHLLRNYNDDQANSALHCYSAPFTHFMNLITLLSPPSLQQVRKLAIHQSVFLGIPGYWTNNLMVEDHLRLFWWHVWDKFEALEEITITDCEDTAIREFGVEMKWKKNAGEVLDPGSCRVHNACEEIHENAAAIKETLRLKESIYEMTLRTYWDLRRQEPLWKAPRWRVWQASGNLAPGKGSCAEAYGRTDLRQCHWI